MLVLVCTLFSFTEALSTLIHQSQWSNSDVCSGPPQSMKSFRVGDVYNTVMPFNESWTEMYAVSAPITPFAGCGVAPLPVTSCCVSSIFPALTGNVTSGMAAVFIGQEILPTTANGVEYCHFDASSSNSLLGFASLAIVDDSSCVEGHYRCIAGLFRLYTGYGCVGSFEEIRLDNSPRLLQSTAFGNVTGSKVTGVGGKATAAWTAYVPYVDIIPQTDNFRNSAEVAELMLIILAYLSSAGTLIHALLMYSKRRTHTMLLLVASQISWLIYITISVREELTSDVVHFFTTR